MDMSGFRVVHTQDKKDGLHKEQRVTCGLTQQQVADKAGILIQHYQKFEGGERNLRTASFDVACRVLEALDLDIVKFFHKEYVLGEERYLDSDGWKYKKTGKPVFSRLPVFFVYKMSTLFGILLPLLFFSSPLS